MNALNFILWGKQFPHTLFIKNNFIFNANNNG